MTTLANAVRFADGLRPCKRAVGVIEQNAEATKELSDSIARLTETLSDTTALRTRSTDREGDESWRQRRLR